MGNNLPRETNKRVRFKKWFCEVYIATYQTNNQPCIMLIDHETKQRVAVATSNVQYPIPDGSVMIKDYAENEGIAEVLENARVIELTGNWAIAGHTKLLEAKLLL